MKPTELIEGKDYTVVNDGSGLSGFSSYLDRTSKKAVDRLIEFADSFSSGRRGMYATVALNMAGVTKDSEGIKEVYRRNPDVINEYFEYVDVQELAKILDVESQARKAPKVIATSGLLFTAGILAGIAGITIYNRKKNKE